MSEAPRMTAMFAILALAALGGLVLAANEAAAGGTGFEIGTGAFGNNDARGGTDSDLIRFGASSDAANIYFWVKVASNSPTFDPLPAANHGSATQPVLWYSVDMTDQAGNSNYALARFQPGSVAAWNVEDGLFVGTSNSRGNGLYFPETPSWACNELEFKIARSDFNVQPADGDLWNGLMASSHWSYVNAQWDTIKASPSNFAPGTGVWTVGDNGKMWQDGPTITSVNLIGDSTLRITWSQPADNNAQPVSGYYIYRSTAGSGGPWTRLSPITPGTATSYDDTNLNYGTNYTYLVSNFNCATLPAQKMPPAGHPAYSGGESKRSANVTRYVPIPPPLAIIVSPSSTSVPLGQRVDLVGTVLNFKAVPRCIWSQVVGITITPYDSDPSIYGTNNFCSAKVDSNGIYGTFNLLVTADDDSSGPHTANATASVTFYDPKVLNVEIVNGALAYVVRGTPLVLHAQVRGGEAPVDCSWTSNAGTNAVLSDPRIDRVNVTFSSLGTFFVTLHCADHSGTPQVKDDSIEVHVVVPQPDGDSDGVADVNDNCPSVRNTDQTDSDHDGTGDACQAASSGSGTGPGSGGSGSGSSSNTGTATATPPPPNQDADGDHIVDGADNCVLTPNQSQTDIDADGIGDACDQDVDGDNVANKDDNCPVLANSRQTDANHNGVGDACDPSASQGLNGNGGLVPVCQVTCPTGAVTAQGKSTVLPGILGLVAALLVTGLLATGLWFLALRKK